MSKWHKLILLILGAWLSMTLFVDIVAVPTAFRNVSSRVEAGNIGMIIFSTFNSVEVVFSLLLMTFGMLTLKTVNWKKTFVGLWVVMMVFAFSYKFYFTPQITKLARQMREMGEDVPGYQVIADQHLFYHELYKKLDSTKILLLLFLIGASLKEKKGEVHQ